MFIWPPVEALREAPVLGIQYEILVLDPLLCFDGWMQYRPGCVGFFWTGRIRDSGGGCTDGRGPPAAGGSDAGWEFVGASGRQKGLGRLFE